MLMESLYTHSPEGIEKNIVICSFSHLICTWLLIYASSIAGLPRVNSATAQVESMAYTIGLQCWPHLVCTSKHFFFLVCCHGDRSFVSSPTKKMRSTLVQWAAVRI